MYPDRGTFEQLYPAQVRDQSMVESGMAWHKAGKTLPVFTFGNEHNKSPQQKHEFSN